ncbi:MAG: NADH-quinone oxidoreductase subunit [Thermomicrobiales bacterium]|nr:NADH-quinone oxidoreductase subunit [Thermomicrobiales bacterium]MEA2529852.1 NADH-quinone oxidoreductase subunit [Thermomicrobiales bacterium]MEA2584642.1 NADH-quinone oxidoreductase subunit [Thermomicrobiales bacterium]MEA2597800.1 NADH-quinone oxidoreductase subunit [Thermomicrobiales bacterium]
MVEVPGLPAQRLTTRAEFEQYQAAANARWDKLWHGDATVVSVGVGSSSIAKGALDVLAACERHAQGQKIVVRKVGVDGADWMEVQVQVKRPGQPAVYYANVEPADVPGLIEGSLQAKAIGVEGDQALGSIPPLNSLPFFKHQHRIVLADTGVIDPDSIEDAIARGAYSAYFKVLFDMSAEEAIAEMTAAGLRGRGGAGFPAGIKWESGRKARATPKFVVCNSHEGEPNVYKDRRIHEGDPHRILEGILIACIVCGAERGYNYIGGEYPLAIKRFRKAVADAERLGLIGKNVLGSGKDVAFRVRTGGGAYICGEGSALMYSVMGVRGQPRTKPPRSVEEGIWKRPTVANNTETLANVRDIINKGGEWYKQTGTEKSAGTKLMTVQGALKTMGLVEVPMGITLRTLIDDVWGGMRDGLRFKGIQTGGVSAGPLKDEHLNLPVDFDSLTNVGGMLGSGGFVVFDETVCSVDFARYLTAFNRYESCSKCVPCSRGNPALVEILDRIRLGRGTPSDLALMERTSKHIIELSLCGLGQVAPMPLLGMMKMYPEEFRAHIIDGVCPTGTCPIGAGDTAIAAGD